MSRKSLDAADAVDDERAKESAANRTNAVGMMDLLEDSQVPKNDRRVAPN